MAYMKKVGICVVIYVESIITGFPMSAFIISSHILQSFRSFFGCFVINFGMPNPVITVVLRHLLIENDRAELNMYSLNIFQLF